MNKNGTLILAASGTGKTTAATLFENVVDLDSIDFAFLYDKSLYGELPAEQLKNVINGWLANPGRYAKDSIRWNPACPKNYIDAISSQLNKGKIVLVPFIQKVFDLAVQHFGDTDIRKIILFPPADNFNEYQQRYHHRGNDENFINIRRNEFSSLAKLFETAQGFEKIVISQGKYLSDFLMGFFTSRKTSHNPPLHHRLRHS